MPPSEQQAQELTRNVASEKVLALCKAASKVRGGSWIEGAPTHILAEMLSALERDGWRLDRVVERPDEGQRVGELRDALGKILGTLSPEPLLAIEEARAIARLALTAAPVVSRVSEDKPARSSSLGEKQ